MDMDTIVCIVVLVLMIILALPMCIVALCCLVAGLIDTFEEFWL